MLDRRDTGAHVCAGDHHVRKEPWSDAAIIPADAISPQPPPTVPRRGCRRAMEAPTTTALLQAAGRQQRQRHERHSLGTGEDGPWTRTCAGRGCMCSCYARTYARPVEPSLSRIISTTAKL